MSLLEEALKKAGRSPHGKSPGWRMESQTRQAPALVPSKPERSNNAGLALAAIVSEEAPRTTTNFLAALRGKIVDLEPDWVKTMILTLATFAFFGGLAGFFIVRPNQSLVTTQAKPKNEATTHAQASQKKASFIPKLLSQPEFILTGITSSSAEKLALINGQVVGEGDQLREKAFVKEIQARQVTLQYGSKELKLSL